jgi:hypothetical protein
MARERAVSLMNRRLFILYAYQFPSKSDRYLSLRVDVRQATLAFPSARAFVSIYGLKMSCQISWQDTAVAQGGGLLGYMLYVLGCTATIQAHAKSQ